MNGFTLFIFYHSPPKIKLAFAQRQCAQGSIITETVFVVFVSRKIVFKKHSVPYEMFVHL